ncbi:MAG: SMC family ATPase [Selenomonadaceae bacterium]|nr:SMC family ATPase [Selenomonadaceae bacterium]
MKPINLKIRAFGPYLKSTEIDFENGLAGSNFFLIHGATGSGKTTILDAICYALYGKCSGEKRTGEMMRSEKAGYGDKTEVEFTFFLDGKIYRVIRSPKYWRQSLRGDGYVEEKAALTIYADGKTVPAEFYKDYFDKLLNFNVWQFRQVVMLPQGEFRKFLMSNSGERGEILNVIFSADFYKLIENKLKEQRQAAELNFNELNSRRKNFFDEAKSIGNVEDDEFNEDSIEEIAKILAENLKALEEEIAQLRIKSDIAVKNLSNGKALYADFETFDKSVKTLQDAKTKLDAVAKKFESAQIEYDARKSEETKRLELEHAIKELKKIQKAVEELHETKKNLDVAEKSELDSQENLKKLEKDKISYEKRLKELKKIVENLDGADVKFQAAKQNLEDATERQEQLNELARLKKELAAAESRLKTANKNLDSAQIELNRLIALQKLGAAAKLAETLKDGEPCPVCGSTIHPHIAISDEIIPSDEDIELAENVLKRRQMENDAAVKSVAKITGNIDALNDTVKKSGDTLTLDDAQKKFDKLKKDAAELVKARKNLKKGEELTDELYKNLDDARVDVDKNSKVAENLRGKIAEKQSQISVEYLSDTEKISADLKKNQSEKNKLDSAFEVAEKNFNQALSQKSKLEGSVKTAENVHADAAKKIEGKTKPDIVALKNLADAAQNAHYEKSMEANTLKENLKRLDKILFKLKHLATEIELAENNFIMWKKLSDTANGKLSFQRYYLNSMFQHVIIEANARLEKMSGGRYQFRNKEQTNKTRLAGLDLEIFDANSGTCRDVATLSGGESFLASLSLALGLAAVVKNTAGGIKLDTIFIDEGFGSLDSETLDYAINTLVELQGDGRLVGIISHVEELKQRVPNRLEIIKNKDGSTAKFIA